MKRNVLPSVLLVVGLFGGGLFSSVDAEPISLFDLVHGGSITQGDKQFDNFVANVAQSSSSSAEGNTVNGQHGFVTTLNISETNANTLNFEIDFKVTVLDPGFALRGVTEGLNFTGDAVYPIS